MKKKTMKEVIFCDGCKKEIDYGAVCCIVCGKEFCYDCSKENIIRYYHSTSCQGSGDGHYCILCDKESNDELKQGYELIKNLRKEYEDSYKEWSKRAEIAEKNMKKLIKKYHID